MTQPESGYVYFCRGPHFPAPSMEAHELPIAADDWQPLPDADDGSIYWEGDCPTCGEHVTVLQSPSAIKAT